MNNTMQYKGYSAIVRYSAEDACLVGHIAGISDIVGFHGDSVEEVRKVFEESVDFYLDSCAKMGHAPNKPYSGRVTLRLPPELHAKLAVQAEMEGSSLNNWMVTALNKVVQQHA
ncbi:MAG: type II toxin-antitoxin system HicB family antitoxin [Deltaproteobacteria bacterium]|jgi:predicted HicB family RNase H-like nuclease|nr:type II toxin-antitoxin system HicB family antitoxin [Deltaproteobacteria bacterium]